MPEEVPKKGQIEEKEAKPNSNLSFQLKKVQDEVSALRARLNSINAEKESWFKKKRDYSRQIAELAKNVKDSRNKRNSYTKQVKDSKQKRTDLNKQIKDKIEELRKFNAEKKAIQQKHGIKGDPAALKKEIEDIEFSIETEGLSFSKEQKLMKIIGEKRKQLLQFKEVSGIFEKVAAVRKELDRLRAKADDTHSRIQKRASESQTLHEEFVESATEIKELRDRENQALKKFVEIKQRYDEANNELKKRLDELNSIREQMGEMTKAKKERKKAEDNKKITEKQKSVEEKIRKKEKLTTEDLLAFQAQMMGGRR